MRTYTEGAIFLVLAAIAITVGAVACSTNDPPAPPSSTDSEIDAVAVKCGLYDDEVTLEEWEQCVITQWCWAPNAPGVAISGSAANCQQDVLVAFGY